MSGRRIFVYGAGGHGKVVADILACRGEGEFAGFVDDCGELRGAQVMGWSVFGDGEWLQREAARARVAVALGVGDARARQRIAERCEAWGVEILTAVHPRAAVSGAAELGEGTVVMAGAVINAEARVGAGTIVNSGAVVEHDVDIGEYAHAAPRAALGGGARLGAFSHLGMGAVVLARVRVGAHAVVGAGAVVVRDLPDAVVAMGVPARICLTVGRDDENATTTAAGFVRVNL
jgi:sugar O-acyltransferase (sialic acid O-acetyltransferase NeuD family)